MNRRWEVVVVINDRERGSRRLSLRNYEGTTEEMARSLRNIADEMEES